MSPGLDLRRAYCNRTVSSLRRSWLGAWLASVSLQMVIAGRSLFYYPAALPRLSENAYHHPDVHSIGGAEIFGLALPQLGAVKQRWCWRADLGSSNRIYFPFRALVAISLHLAAADAECTLGIGSSSKFRRILNELRP